MSSIKIEDLGHRCELSRKSMRAVRGGFGPNVNVNVNLDQKIGQFQDIRVNVLNGNGVIGPNFGAPSIGVNPLQFAMNSAVVPAL